VLALTSVSFSLLVSFVVSLVVPDRGAGSQLWPF
jgi:hypothetical protein